MAVATKKKRTTKSQFNIYIKYLEREPILRTGKLDPASDPKSLETLWEELGNNLNCCGDGPVRTVLEWKKVFTEWKSTTRKKARENKDMTDQERKFIEISGTAAIHGVSNVKEVGILQPVEYEEIIMDEEMERNGENDSNLNANENIFIEVVAEEAPEIERNKKKTRQRKKTGDILTDAYAAAAIENKDGLNKIADALFEIAAGINRYCDILEKE